MAKNNSPDLTKRPPRSPRARLGGYVILPRMLDKGRAAIAGRRRLKAGRYVQRSSESMASEIPRGSSEARKTILRRRALSGV